MPQPQRVGTWQFGPAKSPSVSKQSNLSLLERIEAEFRRCSGADGVLTTTSLATRWQQLVEEDSELVKGAPRARGFLTADDLQVIALRAAQCVRDMDLKASGTVNIEEWMHHMLCARKPLPTIKVGLQIDPALRVALKRHRTLLADLQAMFQSADQARVGSLSHQNIVDMYDRKLWHLHPSAKRGFLNDEELAKMETHTLAADIMEAMDIDGDKTITYGEFMAYCLGRRKSEVYLNLYDLSNGMAASVSPWVIGQRVEGLWHAGVVVFDKEYYFGGDIYYDNPGQTAFGEPTKSVPLGVTLFRQDEFHSYIVEELRPIFNKTEYDVINHNCNHFADRAAEWLIGASIPADVSQQSQNLMGLPTIRFWRPLLNRWLGGVNDKRGRQDKDSQELDLKLKAERVEHLHVLDKAGSEELVSPGVVVNIKPDQGRCGRGVWGTVCKGETPFPSTNDGGSADYGCVWVKYLQMAPTDCSRSYRVYLRTECVPRSRIEAVGRFEDTRAQTDYRTAFQAMMSVTFPNATAKWKQRFGKPASKGGASEGLKPARLQRPGSIALGDGDSDVEPSLVCFFSDDEESQNAEDTDPIDPCIPLEAYVQLGHLQPSEPRYGKAAREHVLRGTVTPALSSTTVSIQEPRAAPTAQPCMEFKDEDVVPFVDDLDMKIGEVFVSQHDQSRTEDVARPRQILQVPALQLLAQTQTNSREEAVLPQSVRGSSPYAKDVVAKHRRAKSAPPSSTPSIQEAKRENLQRHPEETSTKQVEAEDKGIDEDFDFEVANLDVPREKRHQVEYKEDHQLRAASRANRTPRLSEADVFDFNV